MIQSLDIDASYFFQGVEKKSNAKFIFVPKENQHVIEKEVEAEGFKYMHIFSKSLHSLGVEAVRTTTDKSTDSIRSDQVMELSTNVLTVIFKSLGERIITKK